MKKCILLFTALIFFCAAFFTGCPHKAQSVQELETKPVKVIFDKETFDEKRNDWLNKGIKNYRYCQGYYTSQHNLIYRNIVIKNNEVESAEYYLSVLGYSESLTSSFFIQTEDPSRENYLPSDEFNEITSSKIILIEDIYAFIENWYEDTQKKYVGTDDIYEYEMIIAYDRKYPVPSEIHLVYRNHSGEKIYKPIPAKWWTGAGGFEVLD